MEPVERLSSEGRREVEAFAGEIAGGLGKEVEGELAGHIEDKVRGYLRGEEKITEADALLLARHHFGKAEVVRSLLEQAQGHGEVASGFGARPLGSRVRVVFAGMALASAAASIASSAYGWICTKFVFDLTHPTITSVGEAVFYLVMHSCVYLVGPCTLYLWLSREEKRPGRVAGRLGEYRQLVVALVAMIVVMLWRQMVFVPRAGYAFWPVAGKSVFWFNYVVYVMRYVIPNLTGPIVLWCMTKRGRGARDVWVSAGLWVGGLAMLNVVWVSSQYPWVITMNWHGQAQLLGLIALGFVEMVVSGLLLIGVFAVVRRFTRRRVVA